MEKYFLISRLMLPVMLLLCSCSHDSSGYQDKQQDSLLPLWSTKLPGEAGIYNDGLIGLPVYKNLILFHSTCFTGSQGEDNRIHALDVETGEIKWTFPEKYDSGNPMFFWGVPFIYQNLMVVKMSKWPGQSNCDRIICVNLETQHTVWKLVLPENISNYASRDIAGFQDRFYFIQRSDSESIIFGGNVLTGDTHIIYRTSSGYPGTKKEITTNCNLITVSDSQPFLHFATRERINGIVRKDAWNVLNAANGEIVREYVVSGDDFYSINNAAVVAGREYFSCGRKAWCYDAEKDSLVWEYFSGDDYNFATPELHVNENTVFLMGTNRYAGLDAVTGRLLYKYDLECANATICGNCVYVVGRDAQLHMIDLHSGFTLKTLQSPVKTTAFPFALGCKPRIFNNRIYLFGNFNAYCYQLSPDK